MKTDHRHSDIPILILAGGPSTRMGSSKQLLPFQGVTMIRHLASEALTSQASGVTVVTGAEHEGIVRELETLDVQCVRNEMWKEGIASSIRCGVAALPEATEACIIMLSDQPFVSRKYLNRIIAEYRSHRVALIASAYAESVGVPALFASRVFPLLMGLRGDSGAQGILRSMKDELLQIPFPEGKTDIDTMEDYRTLVESTGRS